MDAITTDEAAFLCRKRVDLVTNWCRKGVLSAVRDLGGKFWVIDLEDLAKKMCCAKEDLTERLAAFRSGAITVQDEPPISRNHQARYDRDRRGTVAKRKQPKVKGGPRGRPRTRK